jgi:hypothetical protein
VRLAGFQDQKDGQHRSFASISLIELVLPQSFDALLA